MAKLELLQPKVRQLAETLIEECKKAGYTIIVTQTLRTIAEQDALYAQGRTKPGSIVTNARGGFSLHNFGVAFDICPLVNGKAAWNDIDLFRKIGQIGLRLGLEWGGTWTSFPDFPHFQYLAGYTLTQFRNNAIDWRKFDSITTPSSQLTNNAYIVIAQEGLNIRNGPSTVHAKIGTLAFNTIVTSLEKRSGWIRVRLGTTFGWVTEKYLAPQLATILKVTAQEGLNVRNGPGSTYAKIGKLDFDESFILLEKTNGWIKIRYGEKFGWVSERYVV